MNWDSNERRINRNLSPSFMVRHSPLMKRSLKRRRRLKSRRRLLQRRELQRERRLQSKRLQSRRTLQGKKWLQQKPLRCLRVLGQELAKLFKKLQRQGAAKSRAPVSPHATSSSSTETDVSSTDDDGVCAECGGCYKDDDRATRKCWMGCDSCERWFHCTCQCVSAWSSRRTVVL